MAEKKPRKINPENCKHKKWHVSGYYRLVGNQGAEERTCDRCNMKITV